MSDASLLAGAPAWAAWAWAAAGYLLGSVPFGLLLTRAAGLGDIRRVGSGNIGATNVLRSGSKKLAAATFILDALKGAAPVLAARALAPDAAGLAAMGAFLGHLFPLYIGFRGGKGVATLFGASLALLPPAGLAFAAVWLGGAYLTRYSSVGGMSAAVATVITALALARLDAAFLFGGMAILLILKHSANIARLVRGTEPRIGEAKLEAGRD